ncbi:MAG: bifunctional DNA-formamidopyrimidine glycosylase/DNA-(apurinic or apyrimidinic site) lyase [Dehalococcoidia bacterium]|nr:bifunctional DNA-formamidopyrimidine glycosylase/DNA-(apurinic or apyrimidinic site) lyase [Dehalococcoidia bacterium]
MPELPEVETIKNDLQPKVVGCHITGVRLDWSGAVDTPSPEEFAKEVVGRRIESLSRRGKYLIFGLSDGKYLIVHLRMTGRLLYRGVGEEPDPYTRAVFSLDDGDELRFADLRKFGRLWLVDECSGVLAKVGMEPFCDEFTTGALAAMLADKTGPIKSTLLDQSLVAGVGNIYADEALFLARIHPKLRGGSLSRQEVVFLHDAIRVVLAMGIENRGTTFAEYRDAFGEIGRQQETLRVHRRAGQPCPVCGANIEKITVGGRGTYFCPNCQTIE